MNILRFIIPKSLVEYVTEEQTVRQALEKMRYHRYTAIPVLDREGRYVGTLRKDDVLNYFLALGTFDTRAAEENQVRDILEPGYARPLLHSADMTSLIEGVREHNFVPVVDDRSCFIGIILRRDVLNFLLKFYREKDADGDDPA